MAIIALFESEKCDCGNCLESQKRIKGCGYEGSKKWAKIDEEEIRQCPASFVSSEIGIIRDIFIRWIHGKQVFSGGLLEYPNYIYEAFTIMEIEWNKQQNARQVNGNR